MIVSHAHRYVFMHCRKAAGSSIKVALASCMGEEDVLIGSWNEVLRAGVPLNRPAREVLATPRAVLVRWGSSLGGKSRGEAINRGIKAYYRGRLSKNPAHPAALEARAYFPEEWESYRKFAVTRNPYERAASDYCWRRRMTGIRCSFREYLERLAAWPSGGGIVHPGGAGNWEMMALDGRIIMDHLIRFEHLDADFASVMDKLGVPARLRGEREKRNLGDGEYACLYGAGERALVARLFADEIEAFDYAYPW